MTFKPGVDYFLGSAFAETIMNLTDSTPEDKESAQRYMIKHNAEDLLEMLGL